MELVKSHGVTVPAYVFRAAAEHGRVAVMEWARANGVPWSNDASHAAAGRGRLEALEWIEANGLLKRDGFPHELVLAGQRGDGLGHHAADDVGLYAGQALADARAEVAKQREELQHLLDGVREHMRKKDYDRERAILNRGVLARGAPGINLK